MDTEGVGMRWKGNEIRTWTEMEGEKVIGEGRGWVMTGTEGMRLA